MNVSLGVLAAAFAITFIIVKALKPLAYIIDLVDKPGGRKHHDGVIPLIGGIAIFGGVFVSAYLFINQPVFIRMFMLGGGFLVFMGALDDRYDLSARFRLVGQFLIACIFVYGLEVEIGSFGDLIGLGELRVGWLGFPLAVLSLIGVINAFNMLDGMDGLVGSMGIASFIGLMYLFGIADNTMLSLLCTTFIGAMSAFLVFNLWGKPANNFSKIFMGDAGSMFVGLAIGVLLIHGSQGPTAAFKPITAMWFVLLPMTDMFTIMYRRLMRGRSPMAPDRTHIHHILMRAGFTPRQTLQVMVACQCLLIAIGVLATTSEMSESASFIGILVFVGSYQLLMKRSWRFIRWNKRPLLRGRP
jgi:UDP-GlcNAc:undecaprenyl-phosphate GlcNAc-1-phosphate transferase